MNKSARNTNGGFVDDICHNGRVVVNPMLCPEKFYCVKEADYSENLHMEPNLTIYVGIFKH